jgi:anti-sigma factor RsiW
VSDLNCDEFVELVTAFLDDALDSDGEQRFVDHLATCDGCERYLGQFRQTIRTLGDLPAERLSSATRDALLAALRDQRD